ncbi:hypothetical protein GCM10027217_10780 [Pseudomaricurvus hydrocarbonicus]
MVWLLCLLCAGCGIQGYRGTDPVSAAYLSRALSQSQSDITISAAVPDAVETEELTGIDLYDQGIQPVWLDIQNHGDSPLRVVLRSIDSEYFSPIEVAYMNRGAYSGEGYEAMQRWFYRHGLPRLLPAGERRSGFVYTRHRPGTKGFNVDVFRKGRGHTFTFFVPLPGFTADYTRVDFSQLYPPERLRELDFMSLRTVLETELSCCAGGPAAGDNGGPLNVVMVGTTLALRRSLLRGGWLETRADASLLKGAREHRFAGRSPDAVFYRSRPDGNESLNLHLWLAPWTLEGESIWVGQVYYRELAQRLLSGIAQNEALRNSEFLSRFIRESVAADIDEAQRFLLQNLWYSQSLSGFGIVTGVGASSVSRPELTFDGVGYFTNGYRHVLRVSESPVPLGGVELLYGGIEPPDEETMQ